MRRLSLLPAVLLAAASLTGCESDRDSTGLKFETPDFLITNSMLREKGYEAINAEDWRQARLYFAQAVERRPEDGVAQYYLGLCELRLGEPLKAQFALEKALELNRNDPDFAPRILDKLAEAIYQQDRPESLQAFLEQTVDYYGTTRDRLRQADYLTRIGDLDGARLAYQKAAYFAAEDDPDPYIEIADFYNSINDEQNAVRALRYANHVAPGHPGVAERMRRLGVVPGPTQREPPPKPELLRPVELPRFEID